MPPTRITVLSLIALLSLITLTLFPQTRWSLREEAKFLVAPLPDENHSTPEPLPLIKPDNLSQISLNNSEGRMRVASTLRKWVFWKVHPVSTPERARTRKPGEPPIEFGSSVNGPKEIKTQLVLSEAGEKAEPKNAFFTTMRSIGLLAAGRNKEAGQALREAARKPYWNDYRREERLAVWEINTRKGMPQGAVSAIEAWHAARSNELEIIGEVVREAAYTATQLEDRKKDEAGAQLRIETARLVLLIREGSHDLQQQCQTEALLKAAFRTDDCEALNWDSDKGEYAGETIAIYGIHYLWNRESPNETSRQLDSLERGVQDYPRLQWLVSQMRENGGYLLNQERWAVYSTTGLIVAFLLAAILCTLALGVARGLTACILHPQIRTILDGLLVAGILIAVQWVIAPKLAFLFSCALATWTNHMTEPGLLIPYLATALVILPGLIIRFRAMRAAACAGEEVCPVITQRVTISTIGTASVLILIYTALAGYMVFQDVIYASVFRATVIDEGAYSARLAHADWPLAITPLPPASRSDSAK